MKKTILAVLLVACFVSVSVAADSGARTTSVTRPDVVSPGRIVVHPFVDVAAIQATATKIFVSDAANNVVNIYNTKGKQLGQLTGFSQPQGLASDAKGNLYVADTNNSQILVYAPPYKKAPKKLADPGYFPGRRRCPYRGEDDVCRGIEHLLSPGLHSGRLHCIQERQIEGSFPEFFDLSGVFLRVRWQG